MKKTLVAAAVLGTIAGSALAAEVTLYGVVDMGLAYSHVDSDRLSSMDRDSFSMESGQQAGSRWGLKGTEELGNGLTVGFILEDGFTADDGAESGSMFDRESSLFLEGGFGKLAFGRMGSINQGISSWGLGGNLSAFGTSFGSYSAQVANFVSTPGIWDNMIAYRSPTFAGFTVYAQYSMGSSGTNKHENESDTDRYYALGMTYANGPFLGYLAVDSINYQTYGLAGGVGNDIDDSLTVTLGGNYDFNVAKVFFGAQYFDEARLSSIGGIVSDASLADQIYSGATAGTNVSLTNAKVKGYGVSLSASVPLGGGSGLFGVAYMDAEPSDFEKAFGVGEFAFTRWIVSAGYDYPLSKRTNVYAVASYMNDKVEPKGANADPEWNPSAYTFLVGMRHTF